MQEAVPASQIMEHLIMFLVIEGYPRLVCSYTDYRGFV